MFNEELSKKIKDIEKLLGDIQSKSEKVASLQSDVLKILYDEAYPSMIGKVIVDSYDQKSKYYYYIMIEDIVREDGCITFAGKPIYMYADGISIGKTTINHYVYDYDDFKKLSPTCIEVFANKIRGNLSHIIKAAGMDDYMHIVMDKKEQPIEDQTQMQSYTLMH